VDRRVKTRSDLPGGTPLYILVGMIGFLNVTTYEKKNDFLLIEVFRKLFNAQNDGLQGLILGGHSYMSGSVRILCFSEYGGFKTI
jgi:hypothetical protein